MPNDMQGVLSREEEAHIGPVMAVDLMAFMDCQGVTVGPPLRPDGSGWLIHKDVDAHVVTAWGPRPDQQTKLCRRCCTFTEAVELIRRYEQMLPL